MRLEKDPQEVDHCLCVTEVSSVATRSKSKFTAEVNARAKEKKQFVSLNAQGNGVHSCSMAGRGLLYLILFISYASCSTFLKF